MSTTEDDTAAQLLAQLHQYFVQHPVTGEHTRRPPTTNPTAPANLAVVDHITATVRELADFTRQANPEAEQLPERVQDAYRWCVENTANSPQAIQQRRDTIVFRQRLEHAIAMGDDKVVRPIRCPQCRGLGLFWKAEYQLVVCTSSRCLTKDGLSNRWSLARLATAHIEAQQKTVRVRAT
jgi:hypothetical protein